MNTYAMQFADWLVELGYTHCFFVAGGNVMHLLNALRTRVRCVPFVHEVGAGVAAEYFNEVSETERAFVLVTAGPGVTNLVTAAAGAWLESRELLVIGGQVKRSDLSAGDVRQRGIQEIDGVAAMAPFCVRAERLDECWPRARVRAAVAAGTTDRKGPVFLELPLDVQGAPVADAAHRPAAEDPPGRIGARYVANAEAAAPKVSGLVREAERPVLLLGGGVSRAAARRVRDALAASPVAVMTTWNGADRIEASAPNYFGRPNTWGMRYANVLLQQADCIVALGTRLGLQQTGFNWQGFAPLARVVHVDVDERELRKGHPRTDLAVCGDADTLLERLIASDLGEHDAWLAFAREVRARLPVAEASNVTGAGYVDPFAFAQQLSAAARAGDTVVPCSSGGAFTTMMQAFAQCEGQTIVTNKGLASMGYGLSGAIGAALATPGRRTILVEGDGGFAQNLQELATVDVNRLDLKMFVYANEGYASIRMTQRNYFGGAYLGCDTKTGLGFPRWAALFAAYGIEAMVLDARGLTSEARARFDAPGPAAFVVPVDPEQTYFPKISSRVTATGSMESAPLHEMTPELAADDAAFALRYLENACRTSS